MLLKHSALTAMNSTEQTKIKSCEMLEDLAIGQLI